MGGVDLVDSVMALYRTTVRSKKYYHKIFFHLLVLMYVNAWFLYCRDATGEDQISFLNFKIGIVQGLLKADKTSTTVIHKAVTKHLFLGKTVQGKMQQGTGSHNPNT
jgi:hypothetical protein